MSAQVPFDESSDAWSWTELLSKSAQLGLHAEQLFLIWSRPTHGFGPVMAALEEHLPFQKELEEKGVMFAAGPVATRDGSVWEGEGVFVYRAADKEEAIRIAERDPMHVTGARRFEVHPWCLNEGTSVGVTPR